MPSKQISFLFFIIIFIIGFWLLSYILNTLGIVEKYEKEDGSLFIKGPDLDPVDNVEPPSN